MSKTKPDTAARERVTLHKGADGIAVVAEPAKVGAVRFGDMRPGVEYVVAPAEAGRLLRHKQFDCVDPTQREAALAAFDAAIAAPKAED
jgi:hypothetical protein